ncbi:MAG: ribosome silencing factor [Planctomycetes bacterium]|nr:ribosome silencing factor [Planctomycetota bacterium]MCB9871481.1 ribosome silencing factor [Planctomycetota bacterium]
MSAPEQTPVTDKSLALTLAQIIDEKQGTDIRILDVSGPLGIADYFVIATARNNRHAQALGRELDLVMKHSGRLRRNMAGLTGDSGWVLLDFNSVVVHLFTAEARAFYALESLWADVPRVEFTPADKSRVSDQGWLADPEESYPDSIGGL